MNRRITNAISQQQAAQRRIAWMVWDHQLSRGPKEETGLTSRPLDEIQGTRAWAEKAGGGKERESA